MAFTFKSQVRGFELFHSLKCICVIRFLRKLWGFASSYVWIVANRFGVKTGSKGEEKKNQTHSAFGDLCGWWICWTSPECFHTVLTWTTHPLLLFLAWYWLVKFKWCLAVWIKLALYRVWFQQCHSPILSLFGSSEISRTMFFSLSEFIERKSLKGMRLNSAFQSFL